MRIPIVMVSDNNYILQTKVAIWSMRENTCADIFLEITIICSSQLNINCRTQLRKLENVVHNFDKIIFHLILFPVHDKGDIVDNFYKQIQLFLTI